MRKKIDTLESVTSIAFFRLLQHFPANTTTVYQFSADCIGMVSVEQHATTAWVIGIVAQHWNDKHDFVRVGIAHYSLNLLSVADTKSNRNGCLFANLQQKKIMEISTSDFFVREKNRPADLMCIAINTKHNNKPKKGNLTPKRMKKRRKNVVRWQQDQTSYTIRSIGRAMSDYHNQ